MKLLSETELNKKRSRRLRKKLCVGEFQELGAEVSFQAVDIDFDLALDKWIEFVESNAWSFGGGGNLYQNLISGFLTNSPGKTLTNQDLQLVEDWFNKSDWVAEFNIGSLKDAWHGY